MGRVEPAMAATVEFSHGLLEVEARGSTARHDGWDASVERVHRDGDSLYLAVMHGFEGEVSVDVYLDEAPAGVLSGLVVVFDDAFPTVDGVAVLSDAGGDYRCEIAELASRTRLRVWVDDEQFAEKVLLVFAEA